MNDIKKPLEKTLAIAEKFIRDEEINPVLAYKSPQELWAELDIRIGEKGLSEEVFFQVLEDVVMATPKTASKSFFNQLFGGRNMAALSGEILAAVLNSSMYTFKVAGPQVLIEKEVVAKMLEKVGYTQGDGTFSPGGSISNMIAMMVARNEKDKSIRNQGMDGRRFTAYTSEEGHYSTRKNAGILGLGREQVRMIKSDDQGRMEIADLESQIQEDLAMGYLPFFINSTAGTTVLGAFDPFVEIAAIARKYDIWFHIDGALGGSVVLSRKYRHLVQGCELSDSYTWNAHKMMNVPLTASIILFNHENILRRHFSEKAEYLFQGEDDFNPGDSSIQCGRKNDALKVWAAWKYLGDEGYEQRINRQYELAQYAAQYIKNDPTLDLIQEPACVAVCFEVSGKSSMDICNVLNHEGLIKVGYGSAKKKKFIRMVCVDADMQESDIDNFFEKVKQVSSDL